MSPPITGFPDLGLLKKKKECPARERVEFTGRGKVESAAPQGDPEERPKSSKSWKSLEACVFNSQALIFLAHSVDKTTILFKN